MLICFYLWCDCVCREYTLRLCAELLNEGKLDELKSVLQPYQGTANMYITYLILSVCMSLTHSFTSAVNRLLR